MKKLFVIMMAIMLMMMTACANDKVDDTVPHTSEIESSASFIETEEVADTNNTEVVIDEIETEEEDATETDEDVVDTGYGSGSAVSDKYADEETKTTETPTETEIPEETEAGATEETYATIETEPTTAPTAAPTETKPTDTKEDDKVVFDAVNETVYASTDVNVRKGPGTAYDRVGTLTKGEPVKRIGIGSNGWSKVIYKGNEAYISSNYLTVTQPVEETKPAETKPVETKPVETKPTEKPTEAPTTAPTTAPTAKPTESVTTATTQPNKEEPETPPTEAPTEKEEDSGPSTTITPSKCENHELEFIETKVETQYELYNYVTDYYKCKKCDYTSADTHVASANVSESTLATAESNIVSCVNSLRSSNGLNELWTNGTWNAWADTRASELAVIYGHNRPNGGLWIYSDGTYYSVAENIAAGQSSGYNFYNAFLNSPQHKSAMLESEAVGIAVGIYVDENGATYCAMVMIAGY